MPKAARYAVARARWMVALRVRIQEVNATTRPRRKTVWRSTVIATFPAAGTSEDIAMLLADDKGAQLIVAVGTHATLMEFLDKGRSGMASTFLTRLRVGSKLVDAKGVSRLYRSRVSVWLLWLLVVAGAAAVAAAMFATPTGQAYLDIVGSWWDRFYYWFQGLF
jgi:uncharacterized membrane-anchored protein